MKCILYSSMLILIYCSHNYAYDHDSCDFCNGKIDYDTTIIVKVHSSLPACHIRLTEKEFKAEHSTGIYTDWCYEIRIRKDNCKHEAQYICGKSLSSFQQKYGGGDSDIEFIDYNFDGYIDIGMYSGCSANGMNKRFDIFLFDRMKETFLYSKEFSKILSGTYYEIDPTKREIESAGESGCMGQWWSRNTYRVVNGSPTIVRRTRQDGENGYCDDNILSIEEERLNGVLTVVGREKLKSWHGIPQSIVERFRRIAALIKEDSAAVLSQMIDYPLRRGNPLPDIRTPDEFILYYQTLFDGQFKSRLAKYSDSCISARNGAYGLVGGPFDGDIFINYNGDVVAINYISPKELINRDILIAKNKNQMYAGVRDWKENIAAGKSKKLIIRVDRTDKGLRYVSWSNGHTTLDKPDLILYNGREKLQTGMCGAEWSFKNEGWTYIINRVDKCEASGKRGLFLRLLFQGMEEKSIKLEEIK